MPQTEVPNYAPHHLAMLAGVNRRAAVNNDEESLRGKFGSVIDLEEKKEA